MGRIFLSHSSRDNPQAVALRDWLTTEGWDDLFLDLDPSRGIAAGERWERRLHEAANRCEAILFLVSRAWLASDWCLREFRLAQKLNKRSFGILIEPIPLADLPAELTAHWQFVDLAQGADHRIFRAVLPDGSESHVTFSTAGLRRLKAGLTRAGLDARFFPWPPEDDPDRPPYRGMRPLEAGDAGIFFGREAPTIEALDRLRGLSEAAAPRFIVILGASGAGKSSFLRAGLLPRLARDDRAFLPLPIVRPERAAITGDTGLIRSLEAAVKAAGLRQSRAEVKAAIEDGAPAVAALLAALAEKVRAPAGTSETRPHPPRIVLAIDQAEELFLAEGAAEADAFLRLVSDLAGDPASNLIVIATIRSDAYERLQTAPALEGVRQEAVSLPPMPRGAYQTVIEGPAARLAETRRPLKVEPALTQALLQDVEQGGAKDALPLLAFTLERLYLEHGGDGDLRLSEYRQVGGIRGSIDAAVEGALRGADRDPAVPRDRAAREALLRRALIPWLAGIDPETGAPRRRIARLSEIPEEARPLVTHLVASRLLATDRNPDTGETTVEPAHEALLRQWGLLQGWLEEDFAALSALEAVKRAARDWDANARASDWLSHAAGRLDDAEALLARDDFSASLNPADRAYLTAARTADTARRDRELAEARKLAAAEKDAAEAASLAADRQSMVARRTRMGLIAASLLAILAAGGAWYGLEQAAIAEQERLRAEEQARLAENEAAAAEAARRAAEDQRIIAEAEAAAAEAARAEAEARTAEAIHNESVGLAALSAIELELGRPVEAAKLALASWPRPGSAERPQLGLAVERIAAALPLERARLAGHLSAVNTALFSPDGTRVVTTSHDESARIWEVATGTELARLGGWPLAGHSEVVYAANFSPDGSRVVTAGGDSTAMIWDAATGDRLVVLRGHSNWYLNSAEFSPEGMRVVTSNRDGTARVWNARSGSTLLVLRGHEGSVESATFSPDGTRVVTASLDNTARIWDAATGSQLVVLQGHSGGLLLADFSPDGRHIVTASQDGTARVWSTDSGTLVTALRGHEGPVVSASFSPDGDRVVTGSDDGTARVWLVAGGTEIATLRGHEDNVLSAAFSPDGSRIATASSDRTARVWEAPTGIEIAVLHGHQGEIRSTAFSPDGTSILTASWDNTARLWEMTSADVVGVLRVNRRVESAAFLPDGARLLTVSSDGVVRIWDAASRSLIASLPDHKGKITSAFFPSDGSRIVTASEDYIARVWDAGTGSEVSVLRGHTDQIESAAISPDGTRVVTASRDESVRVWDALSGTVIAVLDQHTSWVMAAVFSPDGSRVLTTSNDQTARVWDARTWAEIAVLRGHTAVVEIAAFSPDGTQVLTGSNDGTLRVWDAETGAEIAVLAGHRGGALSGAFSPDGSRILTLSILPDKAAGVRIWDASTGATVATLVGHDDRVFTAMFSSDGTRVVTAGERTARVWDTTTGAEITVLRGHLDLVNSAVFSPDGNRVVTASNDGTARIWDVSWIQDGDAFAIACARLGRNADLAEVVGRYRLSDIAPICGDQGPVPVDLRKLQ